MIAAAEQDSFAKRGQRFMRWTQRILLLTGVLALGYVALALIGARLYQKDAELTLETQIRAELEHKPGLPRKAIKEGDVLGRIEIPKIGVSVAVLEGTTSRTLRVGVGHIAGTALPGEPGNVGIAGHRDTYFRGLKEIRNDDEILLQTASGAVSYKVDWIQITDPRDGGIVPPRTEPGLTLVTCYPFYYIGSAPERYVVHASKQ
jgi:sortase A